MKGFIYKHTCPNGKSYIGQTYQADPKHRWGKDGSGYGNSIFGNAIKKYGWENIQHEILAEIDFEDLSELNNLEEKFIMEFNTIYPNGYNMKSVGNNYIRSEAFKTKLKESIQKCIPKRVATFKARGCNIGPKNGCYGKPAHNKGKPRSEEAKQKERLTKLAHGPYTVSDAQKIRVSKKISKLKWYTDGIINKRLDPAEAFIPENFYPGRTLSEETRKGYQDRGRDTFLKNNPNYRHPPRKGKDSASYKPVSKQIIDSIINDFQYIKDGTAHYNISKYIFNRAYLEYYGHKYKDRKKQE